MNNENLKISIVGAGLVGSLAAIHLVKLGHMIDLYEHKEDISTAEHSHSINLALSARGRKALAEVGLEEKLLVHGIPLYARMIHDLDGRCRIIPYDRATNQAIYSVGMKYLNEILLDAAEKYSNINLKFNKKFCGGNVEQEQMIFTDTQNGRDEEAYSDLIIGCDGAFSAIRREMMEKPGFNYSQTYIDHGYLELCIDAEKDGEFKMPLNYLHIWPRGEFMMIAIPNQDRTWTVMLFMPFDNFNDIKSREDLMKFFDTNFPDAIPLIGEEKLVKDFFKAKPQHLVTIKCYPYHVSSKCLLIGDAGHAVVPFFGQGMNGGFEDCTILTEFFNELGSDVAGIVKKYSETRWQDAHALSDLSMYNFIEMRDLVNKKSFLCRKRLDDFLFWLMPQTWIPLYNSVSFTHIPYKKCIENREWQDRMLSRLINFTGFGLICAAGAGIYMIKKNFDR